MGTVTYIGTETAGIVLQYLLDANGNQITNLADGVLPTDAVNKDQLDNLILAFEWQDSVLDKDTTTPPGSPSNGDRYLIGTDTTAGVATGAWAGKDGQVAEWNGVSWTFAIPTAGMYIGCDDETSKLYLFGGTAWAGKDFENTTASTGLTKVVNDIRLDSSSAGDGLGFLAGVLNVNVDSSTLETNLDTLRVKDTGITRAKLNVATAASAVIAKAVAGTGITLGSTGADAGTGDVTINATQVTASGGLTRTLDDITLSATVDGAGLTNTAGVLSVNVDNATLELPTDTLQIKSGGVTRAKLNTATAGSAVITKIIAGNNIGITSSTGADSGTGDVTINAIDTGETNTASNVNVGGTGVFKTKSGVDLQFKGIAAGTNIVVTEDVPNNKIDIALNANITVSSITI